MTKLLLDTYCKAGGAGKGYSDAGFKVIGVDIEPQKNYPFEFHHDDAINFINKHGNEFDAIHASPPCQKYSNSTAYMRSRGKEYPDLISSTREALLKTGKPYIIENVPQSPVRPDIVLYGYMFSLRVIRRRHFEINFPMNQPLIPEKPGSVLNGDYISVYGNGSWKVCGTINKKRKLIIPKWKLKTVRETWAYAMGIDWFMTAKELAEAIPPNYTKIIGRDLIIFLNSKS